MVFRRLLAFIVFFVFSVQASKSSLEVYNLSSKFNEVTFYKEEETLEKCFGQNHKAAMMETYFSPTESGSAECLVCGVVMSMSCGKGTQDEQCEAHMKICSPSHPQLKATRTVEPSRKSDVPKIELKELSYSSLARRRKVKLSLLSK